MVAKDRRSAVLLPAPVVLAACLLEAAQDFEWVFAPRLWLSRAYGRHRVTRAEGSRAAKFAQITQVAPVVAGVPGDRRGVACDRRQVPLAAEVTVAVEERADPSRRGRRMRAVGADVVAASNVAQAMV